LCEIEQMIDLRIARSHFRHVLPETRLGQQHFNLDDFRKNVSFDRQKDSSTDPHNVEKGPTTKEYTLIVVTEYGTKRILLGKKHRGFGKGMYNSFGGKVEPHEQNCIATSAIRELHEETGILVPDTTMMSPCGVGTLYFTFEDSPTEMIVHLFRINIRFDDEGCCEDVKSQSGHEMDSPIAITVPSRATIRECEEISPVWFDDWSNIPLNNMFADDSIWLTNLLVDTEQQLHNFKGYFHFEKGGQETNTIFHYYVDLTKQKDLN
jgi:8-oxo-dGTP diphosphatase